MQNDGTPVGMDISDKTLRDISQAVANFLEPKIYPKINAVYIHEKHCIRVEFSGDKAPYLAFGCPYIRVADEDRQMSAAELEKFILKKNAGRDIWDSEPSNKTVSNVDEGVQYLIEKMNWRVVLDGSVQRKEIPEVPVDAIREAITNSFAHRDYRSTQNNEIAVFSDRIEIYNPGRFPDGLTPEDYIHGNPRPIKRNPNLAQLLYYSKDIESFGTGLQRIVAACEEAKVKVSFETLKLGFVVVFHRPTSDFATKDTNWITNDQRNAPASIGNTVKDTVKDTVNVLQAKILGGPP